MSNVSLTPAGGWYADPMDAAQLRWWDGANWTRETMPATPSDVSAPTTGPVAPVTPITPAAPVLPEPAAVVDAPGIYVPRNSVFKMAEAVDGQAYVPEWSGIADISDEVALSGVPVQLSLTTGATDGPPIPVSADAFPMLGAAIEPTVPDAAAPPWQVEQPLAKPIDELFPVVAPPVKTADAFLFASADSFAAIVPPVMPSADEMAAPAAAATVFADIFPTAGPAATLPAAPAPTGAIFPGLVPAADEPVFAEAAPVSVPVLAAVPPLAAEPEALAPQIFQPQAFAPQALAPQAFALAPPAAPNAFGSLPFAEAEPSAVGYEPLVARAIPQPVQFPAPPADVLPPAPIEQPAAQPATTPFVAAPEAAWPTAGTYQPHPGSYVPFDPTAVRIEEAAPAIPFSSRDPFSSASTARPGLRSYGSAPVGPSGSTYTGALVMILLTPLLMAGGYALLFQLQTINVGLAPNLALAGLLVALFFVGIGAAQFDRNALAKRGYFDLASPFWILLSPLVYLGVRASRLRSQGSGGVRAVLLWFAAWAGAAAILGFSTFAALTMVTPERVIDTQLWVAKDLTVNGAAPSVECPSIPSFASGTVFTCIATSASTVQTVQVTITDWLGGESYRVVSTAAVEAPAAAATTP